MNKCKDVTLYDLLYIVNEARHETSDTIIAKSFIESRNELDELSLDQLSQKYYISQASISRFIQKMGYKNYNQFKNALSLSIYRINQEHHAQEYLDPLDIREQVYQDISSALDCIHDIDMNHLLRVIDTMKQYQTIIFMGSDLSMAITHILQMGLIALGKNAYTIYNLNYQNDVLDTLDNQSLVICISLEERWFQRLENMDDLFSSCAYKMLWTIQDYHIDEKKFDDVYYFGRKIKENIGYNELMYFALLVYRLLINK